MHVILPVNAPASTSMLQPVDMDREKLIALLKDVKQGKLEPDQAIEKLAALPFSLAGDMALDTHRELRCGFPEAVLAAGKSTEQVVTAFSTLAKAHDQVLATRATTEQAEAVQEVLPQARWLADAGCIVWEAKAMPTSEHVVVIVSAGASDQRVSSEARATLEVMGIKAQMMSDVGVAGLHRLLDRMEQLRKADALIVCAGMEGALPSVVAGLVAAPVIAVPTSVGYGASFDGLAALLAMLNSCAPGIGVVNIDNGFGAAVLARRMLLHRH